MKDSIIIWGTSGHARVVADIIELQGRYRLFGFIDDVHEDRWGKIFCGAAIIGGRDQIEFLKKEHVQKYIIGFGDNGKRMEVSSWMQSRGFFAASAIHPRAIMAKDAHVEEGTVVAAGVVINPGTKIGGNAIINTCASVDHECIIGNGAHISPGAHIAGNVRVGESTWIGAGTTIIDHVTIGHHCIIGAGSLILHDVPDEVVAYGVPAKIIKKVKEII